jgi:hypothetical protein
VPGDEAGVVGLLAEERGGVDEDVRADQALDEVEERGMGGQLVCPAEVQVGLRVPGRRPLAEVRLELGEVSAVALDLVRRERVEREQETLAPVALLFLAGKRGGQGYLWTWTTPIMPLSSWPRT